MLRFFLKRLIAEKELAENKRISMSDIAEETGIHISTLSRIANQKASNTSVSNLEKLCAYFNCRMEDLVEYVAEERKS